MKLFYKYIKPFIITIIFLIGLLSIQALFDLSLPEYMSKIVNIGIEQNGIEEVVPIAIRKSELDKLISLDNSGLIKRSYEESNKYEVLDDLVYTLKDSIDKKEIEPEMLKSISTLISKNIPNNNYMLKKQASIMYIKSEYDIVGISIGDIQTNYILRVGGAMLGISLISMIVSVTVSFIAAKISAKLGSSLRKDIFRKVESLGKTEFNEFKTSSLITRTTSDVSKVQNLIIMVLRVISYAPIIAVGGIIKVINTNTNMSPIIVIAITAILIVVLIMFKFAVPKIKVIQTLIDKINLILRENLNGILVIRAFNTEKHENKRFDEVNKELKGISLFVNRLYSSMFPFIMFIMNTITILIVWIGSKQVDLGTIQVGDMMAFIQYTMQIIMSFMMISFTFVMIPRGIVSMNRIKEVLKKEPRVKNKLNLNKFNNIKGVLAFRNVSFKYDDAKHPILDEIDFVAKPNETTAFIGSTGSGKSTIMNLILRFYDVTSGSITIDGVDIRDVDLKDLRDNISYVPQKGALFSGTISSNLKYGNESAKEDEIKKYSKISESYDFIKNMESGFDSNVAQGATNVSGGQKQRLSIARALIKKSKIYIFDDSFSALDFKTDKNIRKALKKELKNSTVLIVAQRINTVLDADKIIVLENGKIVGIGKHKELLSNCPEYKKIALSQLSEEELI